MIRPAAVRRFELLWWGSFLIWLAAIVLAWPRTQYDLRHMLAGPGTASIVAAVQPVTVALVLLLTLALWWFVARRASAAARWVAVVVAALAGLRALNLVLGQGRIGFPAPVTTALFVLAALFDIAAVASLFGGDARGWFAPGDGGMGERIG